MPKKIIHYYIQLFIAIYLSCMFSLHCMLCTFNDSATRIQNNTVFTQNSANYWKVGSNDKHLKAAHDTCAHKSDPGDPPT